MKNIYIVDDSYLSDNNGIGTFLREFIACVKMWSDTHICLMKLRSREHEFCIKTIEGIEYFFFPSIAGESNPFAHYKVISKFFRLYLSDSSQNIFLFNYTPCNLLMKSLKEFFPLSKQLFIIHDLSWTADLKGDSNRLESILTHRETLQREKKYAELLKLVDSEMEEFNLADKVVCLSQDTYNILLNNYFLAEEKLCLIPNGLHTSPILLSAKEKAEMKKRMFLDNDEKVLLLVGRISIAKGTYIYLKAFCEVLKSYHNCRLVAIGSVFSPEDVMNLTKTVAPKVTFTGQLSPEELMRWYQVADIGIIPSYTEQCSYSGLEMMRYGLPIVASDGLGVRCMFKHGVNACIAGIEDRSHPKTFEQNLTKATLELLNDSSLCTKMGGKNREIFELSYSMTVISRKYENLLREM
ncbi:glycosyltransferase [Bacteroides sp.]